MCLVCRCYDYCNGSFPVRGCIKCDLVLCDGWECDVYEEVGSFMRKKTGLGRLVGKRNNQ